MQEEQHPFKVVPIGAVHTLPALHLRCTCLHEGLCLLGFSTAWRGCCARAEALLRLPECLTRVSQTPQYGQRMALDKLMAEVKHIWDTQAPQASFGQFYESLSPVTD